MQVGVVTVFGTVTTAFGDFNSILAASLDSSMAFAGGTRRKVGVDYIMEARADDQVNSTSVLNPPTNGNPNLDLFVGAQNNTGTADNFTENRMAAWGAGGGLTSAELSDLRDAIETYMVKIGANF